MSPLIIIHTRCGNCGHKEEQHSEGGDCHYQHGEYGNWCACSAFVRPEDATPTMRVELLFPNHWNVVLTLGKPFVPGSPCMRDGCAAAATRRILVNIWGTVCEYEVCGPCGEWWHGKMVDDFPMKPELAKK